MMRSGETAYSNASCPQTPFARDLLPFGEGDYAAKYARRSSAVAIKT